MIRSSAAIKLVLVGTAAALFGYQAMDHGDQDDSFDENSATTRPSGNSFYGTGSHYTHSHSFWFWHTGSSWGSHTGGSSFSHSGTSRGGFGAHGHAGS